MKPLTITLSAAFLAGNAPPLDRTGSDHHLEVQLAPGSLDLSHASVAGSPSGSAASPTGHSTGATPAPTGTPTSSSITATPAASPSSGVSGPLTLTITQVQGIFVGQVSLLGQYRFHITTAHGQQVSGITLTHPMTLSLQPRRSSCTSSSTLPCFQIDSQSSSYPAVARTFYDSLGRAVESITPVPVPAGGNSSDQYEQVVFTVYDDAGHSVFESNPFTVQATSGWIDPNTVTDYQGNKVYGTAIFYDALDRPIAEQDPAFGSGQAPGNPCPPLVINQVEANATDCAIYQLDTVDQITQDSSDTNVYAAVVSIDPDDHVSESYSDSLGNPRYVINDSGSYATTLTPNEQVVSLYNALNEPVNVTTTDLAPLNNQSVTSVTVTMSYDDLGRLTQEVDPDVGTHSYTYDQDSQVLDDASGGRTIGYNYDLLGRVGCVQSGAVTSDADGSCTTPNNAIIQNTYDTTEIGTPGVTDFPVGRLTKTQATTAYPEGGSVQSTQKFQYDPHSAV
jgi:YD repeat-containing protein